MRWRRAARTRTAGESPTHPGRSLKSWRAYPQNRGGSPCERLALIKSQRAVSPDTASTERVGEDLGFLAKCLGSLVPRAGGLLAFQPLEITSELVVSIVAYLQRCLQKTFKKYYFESIRRESGVPGIIASSLCDSAGSHHRRFLFFRARMVSRAVMTTSRLPHFLQTSFGGLSGNAETTPWCWQSGQRACSFVGYRVISTINIIMHP